MDDTFLQVYTIIPKEATFHQPNGNSEVDAMLEAMREVCGLFRRAKG